MLLYNTCLSHIYPLGQTRDNFHFRRNVHKFKCLYDCIGIMFTVYLWIILLWMCTFPQFTWRFPSLQVWNSYCRTFLTVRCVYQIVYEYNFLRTVVVQFRHSAPSPLRIEFWKLAKMVGLVFLSRPKTLHRVCISGIRNLPFCFMRWSNTVGVLVIKSNKARRV